MSKKEKNEKTLSQNWIFTLRLHSKNTSLSLLWNIIRLLAFCDQNGKLSILYHRTCLSACFIALNMFVSFFFLRSQSDLQLPFPSWVSFFVFLRSFFCSSGRSVAWSQFPAASRSTIVFWNVKLWLILFFLCVLFAPFLFVLPFCLTVFPLATLLCAFDTF